MLDLKSINVLKLPKLRLGQTDIKVCYKSLAFSGEGSIFAYICIGKYKHVIYTYVYIIYEY